MSGRRRTRRLPWCSREMNKRLSWCVGLALLVILLALVILRVAPGSPVVRTLFRLYEDAAFLREGLQALGWLAPMAFIFGLGGFLEFGGAKSTKLPFAQGF